MDEPIAFERPHGRRFRVAGYTMVRLTDGPYRWEVEARGLGVHRDTLFRALVDHTRWAGLPLYRLPGYGVVYPAVQRWVHRHGRCVLKRERYSGPGVTGGSHDQVPEHVVGRQHGVGVLVVRASGCRKPERE